MVTRNGAAPRLPDVPAVTGTVVRLDSAAARQLVALAPLSADGNETGGLLLGTVADGVVIIREIGRPGPGALRTPARFTRDLDHARALAEAAYQRDGSVWVGEWHTHIGAPPVPSDVDLQTYARHVLDPDLTLPFFTAMILHAPDGDWSAPLGLAAWTLQRESDDIVCRPGTLQLETSPTDLTEATRR